MNASELINKLVNKLTDTINDMGDMEVIVDYDPAAGWYSLDDVEIVVEGGKKFINLASSNEA